VAHEGVILDDAYLGGVRARVAERAAFVGFAVGTENLGNPPVAWEGADTAIQQTGVNHDFGAFNDPDIFYRQHEGNVRGIKGVLIRLWIRRSMNRAVARIRTTG
jgi:hypothetical protein